jgi:hypothetical protein
VTATLARHRQTLRPSTGLEPPTLDDLLIWLRAEDLALANNASVSSWVDNTVDAWNFQNGNPGEQPIYQTNRLNGYPTVASNGASDSLSTGATVVGSAVDNWCMWGVWARPREAASDTCSFSIASNDGYGLSLRTAGGWQGALFGTVAWLDGSSAPAAGTVFQPWIMARRAGTTKLWIGGGAAKLTTGTAPSPWITGPTIFRDGPSRGASDGETPECGVYERSLTNAEIDGLGTYMTDKYALAAWTPIS